MVTEEEKAIQYRNEGVKKDKLTRLLDTGKVKILNCCANCSKGTRIGGNQLRCKLLDIITYYWYICEKYVEGKNG